MDPEQIRKFEEKLAKKVNFEFIQAPLAEVIGFVRAVSDLNIIVDPAAKTDGKQVTFKGEGLPLGAALDQILGQAGLRREYRDGAIFVTAKDGKEGAAAPASAGKPEPKPAAKPPAGEVF
jgi:hypothetical protein